MDLKEQIIELIRKAAVDLPEDIVLALEKAKENEDNPNGLEILNKILENINKAKTEQKPTKIKDFLGIWKHAKIENFRCVEIPRNFLHTKTPFLLCPENL